MSAIPLLTDTGLYTVHAYLGGIRWKSGPIRGRRDAEIYQVHLIQTFKTDFYIERAREDA